MIDSLSRRALFQEMSEQFTSFSGAYAVTATGLMNFRETRAAGVRDVHVGSYFTSRESGELRLYKRIATAPGYEDQGDAMAPLTRGMLASPTGAQVVGFLRTESGAITRTLEDKGRDILDARDFGVDPMVRWAGSRNQASKLMDAVNAAKVARRDLVLPHGAIRIDDPLDLSGMFAGGLRVRGSATGSPNAATGTVLVGNTGGILCDFTGSQYCLLEDLVLDGLAFSPPKPSTIGVLFARAVKSPYAQFNGLRNVTIRLPSIAAANGGEGSYAVLNVAAELHDYHNLIAIGDNPVACLSDKPAWLSSPFQAIEAALTSMSGVAFTGITSLTGLSPRRPAFRGQNLKACAFDLLYTVGAGSCALDLDGVENLVVRSGSIEGQNFIVASMLNTRNTEFNIYLAEGSKSAPIVMPATFGSIRNLTLRTSVKQSWTHLIKSGNVGSVIEGATFDLAEDTGKVPTSNLGNMANVFRRISVGFSAGGPMDMDLVRPRILDYEKFAAIDADTAAAASLFLDRATGKLSFKNAAGEVQALH